MFTSNKIDEYLAKSKQNGILVWPLSQPVTQMTHPSMFRYFQTKQSDFYFVHILDTSKFILYNNKQIHLNLMYKWVKCALKKDCIAPLGSKYNGCDYTRRPTFAYSGCHRYEMSSFSILTALLYNFDQSKYTLEENKNLSKTTSLINDYESNSSSFIQRFYENDNNKKQTIS